MPVAALDGVHVGVEEQVAVQAPSDGPRGEATWGGALVPDGSGAAGGAGGSCSGADCD